MIIIIGISRSPFHGSFEMTFNSAKLIPDLALPNRQFELVVHID